MAASVATNESKVAMSGQIMPAPLAMPSTVKGRSCSRLLTMWILGTVSVVIIA